MTPTISFSAYTKVLVIGGNGLEIVDVEIVDLSSSTTNCIKPPDFPRDMHAGVGALIDSDHRPVVCGGRNRHDNVTYSDCHYYSVSLNQWLSTHSMLEKRSYIAGTMLKNGQWLVGGGHDLLF